LKSMSRCVVTEVEAAREVFATLQVPRDSLSGAAPGLFGLRTISSGASLNRRSSCLWSGWYLRFSLSYRDGEELLAERGLLVDHVTVWRWMQRYAPGNGTTFAPATQTDRRQLAGGRDLHPDQGQVALICIVRWILPARPSTSSSRPNAMQRRQSASWQKRWDGRTIPCRASSIPTVTPRIRLPVAQLKAENLAEDCRHRPVPYLNNVLEQDHRAIKRPGQHSDRFGELGAPSPSSSTRSRTPQCYPEVLGLPEKNLRPLFSLLRLLLLVDEIAQQKTENGRLKAENKFCSGFCAWRHHETFYTST
jgi:hypothetical protein